MFAMVACNLKKIGVSDDNKRTSQYCQFVIRNTSGLGRERENTRMRWQARVCERGGLRLGNCAMTDSRVSPSWFGEAPAKNDSPTFNIGGASFCSAGRQTCF
jgi:hypothetical protein